MHLISTYSGALLDNCALVTRDRWRVKTVSSSIALLCMTFGCTVIRLMLCYTMNYLNVAIRCTEPCSLQIPDCVLSCFVNCTLSLYMYIYISCIGRVYCIYFHEVSETCTVFKCFRRACLVVYTYVMYD